MIIVACLFCHWVFIGLGLRAYGLGFRPCAKEPTPYYKPTELFIFPDVGFAAAICCLGPLMEELM